MVREMLAELGKRSGEMRTTAQRTTNSNTDLFAIITFTSLEIYFADELRALRLSVLRGFA